MRMHVRGTFARLKDCRSEKPSCNFQRRCQLKQQPDMRCWQKKGVCKILPGRSCCPPTDNQSIPGLANLTRSSWRWRCHDHWRNDWRQQPPHEAATSTDADLAYLLCGGIQALSATTEDICVPNGVKVVFVVRMDGCLHGNSQTQQHRKRERAPAAHERTTPAARAPVKRQAARGSVPWATVATAATLCSAKAKSGHCFQHCAAPKPAQNFCLRNARATSLIARELRWWWGKASEWRRLCFTACRWQLQSVFICNRLVTLHR